MPKTVVERQISGVTLGFDPVTAILIGTFALSVSQDIDYTILTLPNKVLQAEHFELLYKNYCCSRLHAFHSFFRRKLSILTIAPVILQIHNF